MKMSKLTKRYFLLIIVITFISNLQAQDKENPWVIGFGVNAVDFYPTNIGGMNSSNGVATKWFDQFFNLNDHYDYIGAPTKLSIGRYINKHINIEIAGSINKITKIGEIELAESVAYMAIDVNLNYDINNLIGDTKWFDPYAILGIGFNAKGNNDSNVIQFKNYGSFNSGLGTKLWLTNRFGIKIQSVYKHFFNDGSFPHFQHSASLIYKFGGYDEDNDGIYDKNDKCPEVFGLVEFNGCPDSDEDGIEDSQDECPTVFGLASTNGCPDADEDGVTDKKDRCPFVKGELKNNGCPDTDGDGVINQLDACPNKPGPASNRGCPEIDSDGDGIIDRLDKCKFELGVLSNNGCPDIKKNLEAKLSELANSVLFISGSSMYYSKYESKLLEIADLMRKHNNLKFQIRGYTDNVGSEETNLKLSLARVNTILNYLVSQGINQFNLNVQGFGEAMPIALNDTAEGRAKNRRVEIKIID
jgi:OOP family OmpA-OmpF porin